MYTKLGKMNSDSRFRCFQGLLFWLADYIAIYATLKYIFLNLEVTNDNGQEPNLERLLYSLAKRIEVLFQGHFEKHLKC